MIESTLGGYAPHRGAKPRMARLIHAVPFG